MSAVESRSKHSCLIICLAPQLRAMCLKEYLHRFPTLINLQIGIFMSKHTPGNCILCNGRWEMPPSPVVAWSITPPGPLYPFRTVKAAVPVNGLLPSLFRRLKHVHCGKGRVAAENTGVRATTERLKIALRAIFSLTLWISANIRFAQACWFCWFYSLVTDYKIWVRFLVAVYTAHLFKEFTTFEIFKTCCDNTFFCSYITH